MRRAWVPLLVLAACAGSDNPKPSIAPTELLPPVAAQRAHVVVSPHGSRSDPYYWLRDDSRSRKEVLDYLRAENAYFESMSKPYEALAESLTGEMISRMKSDDRSVPYVYKDYVYSTQLVAGKEYPIRVRTPREGGTEQLLVDGNLESRGHEYYQLSGVEVSPAQDLLAFSEDTGGRYQYTLRFREVASGRDLPDRIPGLSAGVAWASDNLTVFYVENDPTTLLSKRVKRHRLGTDPALDVVIYEEKDPAFYLSVDRTADDRFILLSLDSTEASEHHVLRADQPESDWRCLAPRERGVLYYPDHAGGRWVIRTDWQAPDFRLMTVADDAIGDRARWREAVPTERGMFLDGFAAFQEFLAVAERRDGQLRLRYAPWSDLATWKQVPADEAIITQSFHFNPDREGTKLRYDEGSMTVPDTVYELDMLTGSRAMLKRDEVPGYDPAAYAAERLWAPARDGTRIPVSIVHRREFRRDGSAPLYQYGYGAYGSTLDPTFDSTVVSLLDRGFVYAIAHVRGGQELGRAWYEGGRLLHKMNTFTDFIDVTDFLVREKYAAPDKAFASGLSAGGLLMGAVANLAGEKYRAIAAHVPFVDAVTTMLDESIPLVTNEFDEWGNPQRKEDYDYILSYSPYDNVAAKRYPAMLVTTGLQDSLVQYYEPAKWVARLRATKLDSNPLLFKINMGAGHSGRSGRRAELRETADEYAFFLNQAGISK